MSESKPKTHRVGQMVDVKDGAVVTRPDGSQHTVSGTVYVLDVAGSYGLDGTEVTAK